VSHIVSSIHKIAIVSLVAAFPCFAQDGKLQPLALGDRFFEANAGFSWFSPRGGAWGLISGRRVYLTGLRAEWVISTGGRFGWAYVAEWIPLAVVERTHAGETLVCYDVDSGQVCERDRSTRVAVGTGFAPVGLKMYVNKSGSTRLFISAAGGGIAFSSDVPVYDSRRLNYTFEYGGGVEIARSSGRALSLGYRFHHISNGSSGRLNPGLDANVLYVGLRRRRS
jgi:opacity protein-like surface antigen